MFKIGNKIIGKKVFIIAEMSANHMQDFNIAAEIIKKAKWAGADAIKLQTFTPDTMTIDSNNKHFRLPKNSLWREQTLYQLYKKAYMPWEWQLKLKRIAEQEGLVFFSTPCDKTAVDFLEKLNVPAYKIASYEITDIPLIKYVASKNKPVILSTGVATFADTFKAITACRQTGNYRLALLKCTSAYPTLPSQVNLKTITYLKTIYNIPIGLSDHSLGTNIPIASVALGAKIIEKHLCLSKKMKSLDVSFSLDPDEFKKMVRSVREVEQALGDEKYVYTEKMREGKKMARSLFAINNIEKGEIFTEQNVKSIRPGHGSSPEKLIGILGKRSKKYIKRGTPI